MPSSSHLPRNTHGATEPGNDLGERLRALRLQRQLTIIQVATIMGVTKPHISSIEHGGHRPSAKLLAKLEDFYELAPGELFPLIGQQRLTVPNLPPISRESAMPLLPTKGGIVNYRDGLTTNEMADAIHDTQHAIDILDLWLAENIRRLEGPFREAVKRGVRLRLMLLHPDLAARHMRQVGGRADSAEVVRENIALLQSWCATGMAKQGQTVQLHLLPVLPVMQYHRYDERAFVGFFLHVEQTRELPQLEVQLRRKDVDHEARTTFGRSFWDEFIYFWQVLQEVPLSQVPLSASTRGWKPPKLDELQHLVMDVMDRPFKVRPHEDS